MNTFSKYHSKNGVKLEIEDLDLVTYPIRFSNTLNEKFELISFENKNFLISDSSCYPCSRVYENINGYRWVEILIIPDGNALHIPNVETSVKYSFNTLQLYNYLESFDKLIEFDKIYFYTFSQNKWYNQFERIQFLNSSIASPEEIFKAFAELKLFNAFQFSLFTITDKLVIDKNDIQNYLLNNNSIPLSVPYITPPSFKIKFSNSTNEILETEDFLTFINSLTNEEIKQFFEIEFIEEFLNLKNIYPEFKLDILGIKILERWYKSNQNENVSKSIQDRLESININDKFIRNYYQRLKTNLRSIENKIRISKGYDIVGSLYNESLLYELIQSAFPNYKVVSQYSPDWLGRQRIDIYIKDLNIGIEYNGKQHYEPVDYFGGKDGYIKTIFRDNIKRLKCKKNGCKLIEVKYDEDLYEVVESIKKIII